jgi:hypothetical protein
MAVEIPPNRHLLSQALDTGRINLREYNADLLNSAPFQWRRHDQHALVDFCKKYGYSARDAYGNASSSDQFEESL